MDCARAVLGVAGGANVLLYLPQTFGVVQNGRNLLTQQVTPSSLSATFNLRPKKTASQGGAAAEPRARQGPGVPFSGATERHGSDSEGSCATPRDPPCPQSSRTAGLAESPLTPDRLSTLTVDH